MLTACCNNAPDRLCLTPFCIKRRRRRACATTVLHRFATTALPVSASPHMQAVTEKDLYNDICNAPLDFESSPWDSLSGRPPCAGLAGTGRAESLTSTSGTWLGLQPLAVIIELRRTSDALHVQPCS